MRDIFKIIEKFQSENFDIEKLKSVDPSWHWDCLISELGELARLFKKHKLQNVPYEDLKDDISTELADCIIILTLMAISVNVNLRDSIVVKLRTIKNRLSTEKGRYGILEIN